MPVEPETALIASFAAEISFESDVELETDPDKITEWKDDKKSGSLHEMRSKKIHDKKDDEDEDKD